MLTRARVLAVAALVAGALGSYLWLQADGGGSSKKHAVVRPVRDAGLRTALHYVSPSSPFIAVIQTDERRAAVRSVVELASRLPGSGAAFGALETLVRDRTGLDIANDLPGLLGSPIVVAGSPGNVVLAWLTGSAADLSTALTTSVDGGDLQAAGTYRSADLYNGPGGSALASIGPVVLAGSTPEAVRLAIDQGTATGATMTLARFEARASGVPRSALLRIVANGSGLRSIVTRLYAPAAAVPWVSALSGGALAVSAAPDGLHAVGALRTTPGVLTPDDLPLASGSRAPILRGFAGVTAGVRDLSHLAHFVLAAGEAANSPLIADYKQVDKLLTQFAHIDLDQDILSTLTGPATISTDEWSHFSLRAETSDPSGVADVLSKIAGLGRIGGFLGVDFGGFSVGSGDSGLVTISRDGLPVVTLGVRDDALVASTDPNADFDALAQGKQRDEGAPPDRGALRARISPKALLDLLVNRIGLPAETRVLLEPLGEAIVTAQATGGDISVHAFLPVAG